MGERSAMNWKREKQWSDTFIPEIKRNLGEFLVGEPAIEEDQERNTDLLVLKLDPVRIACRVRRYSYMSRYGNQFTLRYKLVNGCKTELAKVSEGWGDYMFYAFSNPEEYRLQAWRILSLNAFRIWFNRELVKLDRGQLPGIECKNGDGILFRAFDVRDIPNLIFAERGFDAIRDTTPIRPTQTQPQESEIIQYEMQLP